MAKANQKGFMPPQNKGAYKRYDMEFGSGAMDANEKALRASVGSTKNVSKPGSHSTPDQQPSKAMAEGKTAP